MSYPFNGQTDLIIVEIELSGPTKSLVTHLALDTGATSTLINVGLLVAVGYDPSLVPNRIQVTTASGVEYVPRIVIDKLAALGQERLNFPVLGYTLPSSASVDGLLGLDFLRGHKLLIDFQAGRLRLK